MGIPHHEGEPPSEFERYGRFGHHGNDVGQDAISMLGALLEPVKSVDPRVITPTWPKSDWLAFERLRSLDKGVKFIEAAPEVDEGEIGDLHRLFVRLHGALPFSEAEREWMWAPSQIAREEVRRAVPKMLLRQGQEVIMSGGLQQVLQPEDLARRWLAWRRNTDEFAGSGSVHEARIALAALAETLVIEPKLPREWPDIRARFDELEGNS